MIKEAEFKFLNSYGNESFFLRKAFYEEVCAIITDFFEEDLVMNDFHEYFINFLNDLEDNDDVMFINSELIYYWSICIIQNKRTIDTLINGKTSEDYITWWRESYYKKTEISNYLLEPIDKNRYEFVNKNNIKSVFLIKEYYDFICELVSVFFKNEVKNNIQHSLFKSRIDTMYLEESFNAILNVKPYQWALRIIHDKEYKPVLEEEELKKYEKFKEGFFDKNNLSSFLVEK